MKKLNFNYIIADFVTNFNLGLIRNVRFIKLIKTEIAMKLLRILYVQGIIRTYIVHFEFILVYFKYEHGNSICSRIRVVSTPGKRCYVTLNKLSQLCSGSGFSGFYILSTSKGLLTSNTCLLTGHVSGEVLLKIEI